MEQEWLLRIIPLIDSYTPVISFLGAFFGGDALIISLSFLAGNGVLSVWVIFFFALFGAVFFDSIWFFLGRTKKIERWKINQWLNRVYEKAERFIEFISRKNRFLALVFAKFLQGTRIITIIYVSRKGMSFSHFLVYNGFACALWLSLIIALGWLAGKGFTLALEIFKDIRMGILVLFVGGIIVYGVLIWIRKKVKIPQ